MNPQEMAQAVVAMHGRALEGDPAAHEAIAQIASNARAGDGHARAAIEALKHVHGRHLSRAQHAPVMDPRVFPRGPGEPRVGGYGMPRVHRAGVVVGGYALTPDQVQALIALMDAAAASPGGLGGMTASAAPGGEASRAGPGGLTYTNPLESLQRAKEAVAHPSVVQKLSTSTAPLRSTLANLSQFLTPQRTMGTAKTTSSVSRLF